MNVMIGHLLKVQMGMVTVFFSKSMNLDFK